MSADEDVMWFAKLLAQGVAGAVAVYVAAFVVMVFVVWGGWYVSRWVNWEFDYQQQVEQTVREMVKEEALKQ